MWQQHVCGEKEVAKMGHPLWTKYTRYMSYESEQKVHTKSNEALDSAVKIED